MAPRGRDAPRRSFIAHLNRVEDQKYPRAFANSNPIQCVSRSRESTLFSRASARRSARLYAHELVRAGLCKPNDETVIDDQPGRNSSIKRISLEVRITIREPWKWRADLDQSVSQSGRSGSRLFNGSSGVRLSPFA